MAAGVKDGDEDGVDDGKDDADALVEPWIVGLGQVLWRARRRASHDVVLAAAAAAAVVAIEMKKEGRLNMDEGRREVN